MAVHTHNRGGYRRGCRCPICRADETLRRSEQRARRPKTPCDVCRRVHPGRCLQADARSARIGLTLPGWVARRLRQHVPWGDRSAWIAALIERELDLLDEQQSAA